MPLQAVVNLGRFKIRGHARHHRGPTVRGKLTFPLNLCYRAPGEKKRLHVEIC